MTPEERKAHPLYEDYWEERKAWRSANFGFIFGAGPTPTFPTFEEWLEQRA